MQSTIIRHNNGKYMLLYNKTTFEIAISDNANKRMVIKIHNTSQLFDTLMYLLTDWIDEGYTITLKDLAFFDEVKRYLETLQNKAM